MRTVVLLDEEGNEYFRKSGDCVVAWAGSDSTEFPGVMVGEGKHYGDHNKLCRVAVMISHNLYEKSFVKPISDILKARKEAEPEK
jgi:hypothetical protein